MLVTGMANLEALGLIRTKGRLPYEPSDFVVQYEDKKSGKTVVGVREHLWLATEGLYAGSVGSFLWNETENPHAKTFRSFDHKETAVFFIFGQWQQGSDNKICFMPASWPFEVPTTLEALSPIVSSVVNGFKDYKFLVDHKGQRVDIEEFPPFWMPITYHVRAAVSLQESRKICA